MVRFCDMLPSTVRHQTSAYSLAPNYSYQPVYPQYNENCNVNSSTLTNVDSSGNGNYQQNISSSWPAVYAVSANSASRQPIHYEDWMTAASNACSYQSQAIGYSTYHFQRNSSDVGPTDFSLQSSGPMGLQECLGVTKTEGHPSPDSVVAVSSDGMSGSESPGLSLHINQNGVNGLCRPQPARSPFEWMKKTSYQSQPNPGKTRTKDKYRVVYTDHQRLELEKEFHYSRYITIRRKSELASMLGLSERQVKIWFQNRRAKERKQAKKREELIQKTKDPLLHQQANPMSIATLSLYKPMVSYDHENNM